MSVNAHAEELRKHFVAHEGKKELKITMGGTRHSVDFGAVAQTFADLLHENVRPTSSPLCAYLYLADMSMRRGQLVDREFRSWVLPDFTTTTANDRTISAVVMMSTLKS